MRVVVLSSGSKGNTTYINVNNHHILIDIGNSCRYVCQSLENIDVDPSLIDTILITHTHKDHTAGLDTFLKKYNPIVCATKKNKNYLGEIKKFYEIDSPNFEIDGIKIEVIRASHDAPETVGYIITYNNKSLVYITDTGYINKKYFDLLKNKDIYILESNHDVELLMNGSYPFDLKKRIVSDKGHLSNHTASLYLKDFIGDKTKYIILAHLSEENNSPSLAYSELVGVLGDSYKNEIIIAKQNEKSEMVLI